LDKRRTILGLVSGIALLVATGREVGAQAAHAHTPAVSGMPQGVPLFCSNPTVISVGAGPWAKATTWSTGKVPGAGDRVAIGAGHSVSYDVVSDAKIGCIEVSGTLAFSTKTNTRLNVVTLLVVEGGTLRIGTATEPVAPDSMAEVVIGDQRFDPVADPGQIGHGIVVLGTFTAHGAAKSPTFVRLIKEPLAGQTVLTVEDALAGWRAGDTLVLPDTRQLRDGEPSRNDRPQHETVRVASISGLHITLAAPLAFEHKGARDAAGTAELLPHVGNLSRNVVIRSENPKGVRGHTMFISHADVDVRYARFEELGRTKQGILDSTEFDSTGNVARIGTNQIGRYAVHFHHDFGPLTPPPNGYQFTLVGNVVDGAAKWGVTVHRSHYGLIKDNVVYNTRGAGIVTEDGSESFNVFDHNFSLRTTGSTDAIQGNGYSATLPNPGGEGSAFWFRGPNNYIRNNVAANAAESGFGLPVTALGTVRVPKNKGADTSKASESMALDTTRASVLEFSGNEAYGALQNGVSLAWSGAISRLTVWHSSRHAVTASPTERLMVDKLVVRGDPALLASAVEHPVGIWVGNYAGKAVSVGSANVQGLRVGVQSPFFYGQGAEANGSLTVENSFFRTSVGVSVATSYADDVKEGRPLKTAIVRSSTFEPLDVKGAAEPLEGISMNYGTAPGDARPRVPVRVYDYNKQPGNDFSVYYSFDAPPAVAPCHDTMPGVGGWVCRPN